MPTSFQYDAFVSYRHREPDQSFVLDLVQRLERDGYRVAIDFRDFRANENFLNEMERCVKESAFTLAVVSPRYMESDNADEEIVMSKTLDMSGRTKCLIRLDYEQVTTLPLWLYALTGIDWNLQSPLVDAYTKLKATLGTPQMRGQGNASQLSNPFVWRGPVTEVDAFFDREREQRQLQGFLSKRQNCQIVGERRIGKTSLLLQVARNASTWQPDTFVAFLDMQYPTCFTLAGFLRRAGTQLGWSQTPASLTEFAEGVEAMCRQEKRPVLCIDEFEEFARRKDEFDYNCRLTLRACSQLGMSMITTSHQPLSKLTDPDDKTSPFYNSFPLLSLGAYLPHDAEDFVTLSRPGAPAFTPEEKSRILEFARNHPMALQVGCYHVVEAKERGDQLSLALQHANDEMRALLPSW